VTVARAAARSSRTPAPSSATAAGLKLPATPAERDRMFWRLSRTERVALMRCGQLTLAECCRWAACAPQEVPVVNGEFEFISAFTPEATES
jgi:hypothetical protein